VRIPENDWYHATSRSFALHKLWLLANPMIGSQHGRIRKKATYEFGTDAAAANHIFWLSANPDPGSRRHPKRLSSIK
jgi:hypothetical protein